MDRIENPDCTHGLPAVSLDDASCDVASCSSECIGSSQAPGSADPKPAPQDPKPTPQQKKITLYTSATCGYCWRAERLLTKKGYTFETVDVTFDRPARAWLAKQSGQRTVPQIKIGERWVGGFDEIDDLDERGELDRIVR